VTVQTPAIRWAMRWVALGLIGLCGVMVGAALLKSLDPMTVLTACLVVVGAIQWMLIDGQDEHFTNSERAWVLADLAWDLGQGHVINSDMEVNGLVTQKAYIHIKLNCRNEGKSPAWIDKISAQMGLVADVKLSPTIAKATLIEFGTMEPLGPNKEGSHILEIDCDGRADQNNYLIIYVVVDYHDIFEIARQTTVVYSISPGNHLRRLREFPKLNQNS
jgi:hypothetical protein